MTSATVILAAGSGTRMKSLLPKVLHPVAGIPMVEWSVRTALAATAVPPVVVVGNGSDEVMQALGDRCRYALQETRLGTAHALMQAESHLRGTVDTVIAIYADMPLLRGATLHSLLASYQEASDANPQTVIAMLTITRDDPQGFGRIVRDESGAVVAIVEEADCTDEQRAIRELNPGIYCFNADWLWHALPTVQLSQKGEYYLTDMVAIAHAQGMNVLAIAADAAETNGINTRVQLAHAENAMRRRINEAHMLNGVTIADPAATYIDADVMIGSDTTIWPGTMLLGATTIGEGCLIGPNAQIIDSHIADGCKVNASMLENARMDVGAEIGPFGHLRSGAHLGEGVHMGNFGEVKNSYLAPGVKMGHFSYIGDAQIGLNANIGAGTITCNFDGKNKNKTNVGDDVFIGSDTLLVAPVTLGNGARTGAGSVVTRDVPAGSLVYGVPARPPAKTIETENAVPHSIVKES